MNEIYVTLYPLEKQSKYWNIFSYTFHSRTWTFSSIFVTTIYIFIFSGACIETQNSNCGTWGAWDISHKRKKKSIPEGKNLVIFCFYLNSSALKLTPSFCSGPPLNNYSLAMNSCLKDLLDHLSCESNINNNYQLKGRYS